jgi:hypothetical protein
MGGRREPEVRNGITRAEVIGWCTNDEQAHHLIAAMGRARCMRSQMHPRQGDGSKSGGT